MKMVNDGIDERDEKGWWPRRRNERHETLISRVRDRILAGDLPPQNRSMLKERIFDTHSVRPPNLGGFA